MNTEEEAAPASPLRLRVGVLLICAGLVRFWTLAPAIAHSLSGTGNAPSVAAVTTTLVVAQTILGLLGFWIAGSEVKAIVKGSTTRHAVGSIWLILIHGRM